MRLPLSRLSQIKNWIHIAQAIVVFIAWALTIGVFTSSGASHGQTGWYFAVCWLTIPILVYLTMVPMWSRARKFSNVYAFAGLDLGSIVLWATAWLSVTSYVVQGKGKGTSTDANLTGCDNFKFGSATKCKLSEATIVFGVIIMLMFVPTAYVSFKNLMEYKRTGVLPHHGQASTGGAGPLGGAKPISSIEDDAFDSNMNARNDWEVDEYEHDEYHRDPRQGGKYAYHRAEEQDDDEYTGALAAHSRNQSEVVPGSSYEDLSQARPTLPGSPLGHQDTEYRSGGGAFR